MVSSFVLQISEASHSPACVTVMQCDRIQLNFPTVASIPYSSGYPPTSSTLTQAAFQLSCLYSSEEGNPNQRRTFPWCKWCIICFGQSFAYFNILCQFLFCLVGLVFNNTSQAGFQLAIYPKVTLNFLSTCLHLWSNGVWRQALPHPVFAALSIKPQGCAHTRQALYQMSYNPNPYMALLRQILPLALHVVCNQPLAHVCVEAGVGCRVPSSIILHLFFFKGRVTLFNPVFEI